MTSYTDSSFYQRQTQDGQTRYGDVEARFVPQQDHIVSSNRGWQLTSTILHTLSIAFCAVVIATSVSLANMSHADYGWLLTVCITPPVWTSSSHGNTTLSLTTPAHRPP